MTPAESDFHQAAQQARELLPAVEAELARIEACYLDARRKAQALRLVVQVSDALRIANTQNVTGNET